MSKVRIPLPPGIKVAIDGESRDYIDVEPEQADTIGESVATLARSFNELAQTLESLDDDPPPATHH